MPDMINATNAMNIHNHELLQKQGVCGTGVGHKLVNGKPTGDHAILVFVQKKFSESGVIRKFSADELIPSEIDGIPTDVIEVGRLRKQDFRSRVRPLKPGYSVGHGDITCGTIGGFFTDKDGDPVLLSNNHVLACENKAQAGDLIYQPGPTDMRVAKTFTNWGNPVSSHPYVGTLKSFAHLNGNGNTHDSAIMRIHDSLIKANLIDALYPTINRPISDFGDPTINMPVQKCGRTTGYTTGRVIGLNATFTIEYDFGNATFSDCVVLTNMSQGGDSGSMILDMDTKAVALLFAGSKKVTIASPIRTVRDYYGLQLWDGPQVSNIAFGEYNWRIFTTDGSAKFDNGQLEITENSNQYCFVERSWSGQFAGVTCVINSGTDVGASWGPGIVVQWPNGYLKVNIRHRGPFCGTFNGNENLAFGVATPNTDYTLRIRKSSNSYVGEVLDGGQWHAVITIPLSVVSNKPVAIRIGKTGLSGSASDYAPSGSSDAGPVGTCVVKSVSFG
jgi:hypothetical protein